VAFRKTGARHPLNGTNAGYNSSVKEKWICCTCQRSKESRKEKRRKRKYSLKKAKEASVVAKPAEKVMKAPVAEPAKKVKEAPVKATKPVVPMTLEEKILDYINKHPKGVSVAEMEKPLGETRMKLGYVAKKLMEAGKVQKVDNHYFPLKK